MRKVEEIEQVGEVGSGDELPLIDCQPLLSL
jgi:hypothetical protein